MRRLLVAVGFLAIIVLATVSIYAMFGDLSAPSDEIVISLKIRAE